MRNGNKNIFFLSDKNYFLILLVHFLFEIGLQFVPLTNILSYDFAIVNSIWLSIVGVIVFFDANPNDNYFKLLKLKLKVIFIIIFSALLISLFVTLFIKKCPPCFGIVYFGLISIPAFFIGSLISFFLRFYKRTTRIACVILIYLFLTVSPILEIYFNPQIYFYHPLIVFFPGTIYDENISIDFTFLVYRILTLLFFFVPLIFEKYFSNKKRKITLHYFILGVLLFSFFKTNLGFSTNLNKIQRVLTQKISTTHFDIYCSAKIESKQKKMIAAEHEYYFEKLFAKLKVAPKKITSFLFENKNQKKKYFGAENADVAKPWLKQIYLEEDSYYKTLNHELAHVFAGEFGVTPFRVAENINFPMIEGFAVAMEDNFYGYSIHEIAKTGYESGFFIDPDLLFKPGEFFVNASSISYLFSGSFVKFLMQKYGIEKVKNLYADLNFKKYTSRNLEELSSEYILYIKNLDIEVNKNVAQLFFGRRPLVKKICGRYEAEKMKEAGKLYRNKNFISAENSFKKIFEKTNSFAAFLGIVNSLRMQNKFKNALKFSEQYKNNFKNTSFEFQYNMTLADLYSLNLRFLKADSIYQKIYIQKPSLTYKSIAAVRLLLLRKSKEVLKDYLTGSIFDKYQILYNQTKNIFDLELLPVLISLSESLNENYNLFKNKYFKLELKNFSATTLNQLSEFSYRNYDFENAIKFDKLALKIEKNIFRKQRISEHLNKTLWVREKIKNDRF